MKGEQRMLLPRKPIQDISVIDVAGDIDFREMIRIKDTIGSLIEKERIKVVLNLRSVDHINYLSIGVLLERLDRKSTRLNSSHGYISYAVFCLKKKKK